MKMRKFKAITGKYKHQKQRSKGRKGNGNIADYPDMDIATERTETNLETMLKAKEPPMWKRYDCQR